MKTLTIFLLASIILSCSQPETTYLDELDLSTMVSGWGKPHVNKSITNGPLLINGQDFERGIGTHATSTFMLDLGGKAQTFSARVGLDDAAAENGSIQFYLIGDHKLI